MDVEIGQTESFALSAVAHYFPRRRDDSALSNHLHGRTPATLACRSEETTVFYGPRTSSYFVDLSPLPPEGERDEQHLRTFSGKLSGYLWETDLVAHEYPELHPRARAASMRR